MAENKTRSTKTKIYFWLKVDKKFFDNIFIKRLKSVQGGYAMTVIYIRLMLESLADDCILYYEGYFENLAEELALKLDVSEDDINQTLAYFTKCGLIQIDDNQNAFMQQAEAMVEQETNWATYKRNNRRIGQSPTKLENVQQMSNHSPTETELKKETELKRELKKEKDIKLDEDEESKTTSKQEIYIDNFDATTDFSKIRNIEDYLGDNYLTNLSDEELITGFTQYYLARVPDNYELNTLKKRLKTIDREILQQAYKQASMNGADTLAYIVATLKNWEELNITTLDDWNKHEAQREQEKYDNDLPF